MAKNSESISSAAQVGWKMAKLQLIGFSFCFSLLFLVCSVLHRHRGQHVLLRLPHLQELFLVALHVRLHVAGGHRSGCNRTLPWAARYSEEASVLCELHVLVQLKGH